MAKKDREWMDQVAQPKIGAGHAHAWLRQGAKELAQFLPAFNNGQHVVEENGLFGNITPGEVYEAKRMTCSSTAIRSRPSRWSVKAGKCNQDGLVWPSPGMAALVAWAGRGKAKS